MAQNILPPNFGALVVLAGKCGAGLNKHAAALEITQITQAGLKTQAAALTKGMNLFNAARKGRTDAQAVLNTASAAAKKYLSDARGVLVANWGEKYGPQWLAAGWVNHSTAVPDTQPDRLTLLRALQEFLTKNPALEVNATPIVFTAARADAVHGDLEEALQAIGTAETVAAEAKAVRTNADTALRNDIRILIGILSKKLTPNDPRWLEFGLNQPGAAVTPSAPENLESEPALPGQLHATCDAVAGADGYRWFLQLPGQTEFVFQAHTSDPEVLLQDLPTGQTVQLRATAVNPGGESVPGVAIGVKVG